ncbi:MAG: Ltp family lipoprotein [Oscillospiraceae bacterium]|nr:Ltp family lipoprotein [Oscillospiraceae bacterium]
MVLIDQLEYEGFTNSQATYGADNCNADWNEQAAKSAENYLDIMSFSRDELIGQLQYEGYTYEQAVYGATKSGY